MDHSGACLDIYSVLHELASDSIVGRGVTPAHCNCRCVAVANSYIDEHYSIETRRCL